MLKISIICLIIIFRLGAMEPVPKQQNAKTSSISEIQRLFYLLEYQYKVVEQKKDNYSFRVNQNALESNPDAKQIIDDLKNLHGIKQSSTDSSIFFMQKLLFTQSNKGTKTDCFNYERPLKTNQDPTQICGAANLDWASGDRKKRY